MTQGALGSAATPGALRVLIVIDSLGLGGAERLLVSMAEAAPAANLVIEVTSISGALDARNEMVPALRALGIEPRFLGIRRLLDPRALPAVRRAVRTSGCDIVHAHLEYASTLAPVASWSVGRPTVCTFHHVPSATDWRTAVRERLAVGVAARSQRTIFVSEASLHAFAERYRGPRRNWTVVRNGIDIGAPPAGTSTLPGEFGIRPGAPVVLFPAALRGRKGHESAIEAWADVRRRIPEAVLLLVGSGPQEAGLHALAERRGVSDAIVFAGFRHDVSRLIRASELVILPSETEALPTVLMEAAACGRPVVATDVEGIPEVVDDGLTGVLVPPGDAAALADAIAGILEDGELRFRLGAAARHRSEADFSVEGWVSRLRVVYEQAIADRTSSRPAARPWTRSRSPS